MAPLGTPDVGAGDTAFDCATSAIRCGARKVFVVFRKGTAPRYYDVYDDVTNPATMTSLTLLL